MNDAVLVTGGAGFIGAPVARRLYEQGYAVTVLDFPHRRERLPAAVLQNVDFIGGDPSDAKAVAGAARGAEYIFHFAGPIDFADAKRMMDLESAFLEASARAAVSEGVKRLIYASSCSVYGNAGTLVDETVSAVPLSGYGKAKRHGERRLQSLHRSEGLQSICLRCFNAYGARQHPSMAVPRFMRQALAGESITLYSGGRQVRDFIHIDDIVEATLACAFRVSGHEAVNISTGHPTSIQDLAAMIIDVAQSDSKIMQREPEMSRGAIETPYSVGANGKLCELTGFVPKISLRDGLEKTLRAMGKYPK